MASNIIITFQTKADTTGSQQVVADMERVKKKAQEAAQASRELGSTFKDLQNIVIGTVLSLPLAGFVKEAMDSETAMKKFDMSLRAFGQDVSKVDLDSLTEKAHNFGIAQTELVTALSTGLPYFHSVQKEVDLMDTAMGMARFSGQSLASTFRALGYVAEYGVGRAVRQFGVSMHTEIHDKARRGAAIIAELTEKFGGLAGGARTTAEELATAGSTIKDMGEKISKDLLVPIAALAKEFNKLSDSQKEMAVQGGLIVTTLSGMVFMLNGLLSLGEKIAAKGGLLKILGLGGTSAMALGMGLTALIPIILAVIDAANKARDALDAAEKQETVNNTVATNAFKARASDASTAIGLEKKFADKLGNTQQAYSNLILQAEFYRRIGNKGKQEAAIQQAEQVKIILDGQKKEFQELDKHHIDTLDRYNKFQIQMRQLANAAREEGLDKDLDALRIKIAQEKDALVKAYGDEMDVRLALAGKEAAEETSIRKKEIDGELAYALMSYKEQAQYDNDRAKARVALANLTIQGLRNASDETKKLLQTAGGKEALKDWEQLEAKRQALFHPLGGQNSSQATTGGEQQWRMAEQNVAIAEKALKLEQESGVASEGTLANLKEKVNYRKEILSQLEAEVQLENDADRTRGEKKLNFFKDEKTLDSTNIKLETQVNINITPNPKEMAQEVSNRLQMTYNMWLNGIEEGVKSHNVAAGAGGGF